MCFEYKIKNRNTQAVVKQQGRIFLLLKAERADINYKIAHKKSNLLEELVEATKTSNIKVCKFKINLMTMFLKYLRKMHNTSNSKSFIVIPLNIHSNFIRFEEFVLMTKIRNYFCF